MLIFFIVSFLPDMINVEHMGVSPPETKCEKGNHFAPEETTSEQAHELGSEYLHTELSENKHPCGYAITRNESAETATGVSCSDIHESSSGYVDKNSPPEQLGLLPKYASEHNLPDNSFCHQETVSGMTHEYGSGYVHETSEKKHQPGFDIVQNNLEKACTLVFGLPAEHFQPCSEDFSKNALTESLGVLPEDSSKCTQIDQRSCPQLGSVEPTAAFGSINTCKELGEPTEQQQQLGSESLSNGIVKSPTATSRNAFYQALELNPEVKNQNNCGERLQSPSEGASIVSQTGKSYLVDPLGLPPGFESGNSCVQQQRLHSEDMAQSSGVEQHEATPKNLLENSVQGRDGESSKTRKKYTPKPLTSSDRVLRSKSQEKSKASELSNNITDIGSSEQQKGRNRNKMIEKREVSDEYSRTISHLRYLVNRINYERSLIAAYSTEGWKGLSLEKLKPEKELQRATSEILRRKLKIRDLFQRIDSLCAEGRLPESLFDSKGEIDIPPGDEGWLCPGCYCKLFCIELLLLTHARMCARTHISILSPYHVPSYQQKVFPEAVVAAGGQNQDPNLELPSDDSDDSDYNADNSEPDEKDQGDESSFDESDFTCSSEELEVPRNVDPCLGLLSDDSEDDDYDPHGLDHDIVAEPKSSTSDFTSDSEDLGAMLKNNSSSPKDEGPVSNIGSTDSKGQKPKLGGNESRSDEPSSIMDSTSGQDGTAVSKKRSSEKLDYKKLYDETYVNFPSSSSDDEDWSDTIAPRKRKRRAAGASSAPENGNASSSRSVSMSEGSKLNPEHKLRNMRQNSNFKDINLSPAELKGGTSVSGSSGKKAGSSTHRRLGETEKQRLCESFRENQYPDRATKERLGKELDMTVRQVSKWFENARWSFNHPTSNQETAAKRVAENAITSAVPKKN
ncbi:homeobox protein HAT3.1-like isoform X1 [Gossypium australe]|uniref:Homeobox protein HAT3.1-like isoform X1 n=1 Tax=Gossypium australe TaxID=47621 RepID=A0A5B6WN32_9ROSI|nr:homeobox protein HAT3.1-like isoform X1 [Gossypium australe]